VWQSLNKSLTEEVIMFWLRNGALLNRETAEQRATQVAYIARTPSGQIVAVTTVYLQLNEQLRSHFYYVRVFVADSARRSHVAEALVRKV